MLDDISKSDTIPVNDIRTDDVEFSHEASIGKISDKTIFYLMSRGLSQSEAKQLITLGYLKPISVHFSEENQNKIIDAIRWLS